MNQPQQPALSNDAPRPRAFASTLSKRLSTNGTMRPPALPAGSESVPPVAPAPANDEIALIAKPRVRVPPAREADAMRVIRAFCEAFETRFASLSEAVPDIRVLSVFDLSCAAIGAPDRGDPQRRPEADAPRNTGAA